MDARYVPRVAAGSCPRHGLLTRAPTAPEMSARGATHGQGVGGLVAFSPHFVFRCFAGPRQTPTPLAVHSWPGQAFENSDVMAGQVALVKRGVCSFVEKAAHAQSAGAAVVMIYDNNEENYGDWCVRASVGLACACWLACARARARATRPI